MPGKTVLIIGGGVAGIAAGVALAEAGLRVELVEKRPLLGGRASSFVDPKTGERIDECQHGTMRCCTNLADLYERLGVQEQIRYHDTIHFLDGEGKRSVITNCGLPAPMHTAFSFLAFRSLGVRDKIGIGQAMLAMLRVRPDPRYDALDIATWFRQRGQTERAVKRFWTPILVSACNEVIERISCTHAFKIFRDGFLMHPQAFHFGVPRVPLASLVTEPALAYLQARGGCVRLRTTVDQIHFEGGPNGRVAGVTLVDGERLEADYYVSALQFDLLLKLLPPEVTTSVPYWENLRGIELSPIIGVHLWFDRPIDCPEALALLDRETEWIFNKTKNFDRVDKEGTYLSAVISASHRYKDVPNDQILATVLADVHACLPETREATLVRSRVIQWPKATISPKPGVDALRPGQRSPLSNLYVAGEWTQTGWPSTMEGAARSGYLAAEYLLEREGTKPQRILAPDLPPSGLAGLLDGYRGHRR
ncbi:MAG TPA: hydroxysqualene dehydroxylase HpnE [Chthonomonadaceae bacterium]|nr:hydroxysqualene dehydroxylase HpnE [Chthonomonadaceae bacterium]